MTEVTVDNFDDLFPQIVNEISNCSFVSVHVQVTGEHVQNVSPQPNQALDVIYDQLRQSVIAFIPCQIGLSIFRRRQNLPGFKCCVYNFFLCPRFYDPAQSRMFNINTSTAEMLQVHGFDFNRMFAQGISFMNELEESELRVKLGCAPCVDNMSVTASTFGPLTHVSPLSLDIHEQILDQVTQSLADWRSHLPASELYLSSSTIRLSLAPLPNELHCYLLIRHLRQKFTDLWIELDSVNENMLLVRHVTRKERQELENDTLKFENEIIVAHLVGFSRLFRSLVDSRKPVVGCEMLLPLLHCMHHFLQPLPEDLNAYIQMFADSFSSVYDIREVLHYCRQSSVTAKPLAFFPLDLPIHQLYQKFQSAEFVSQLPKEPEVICVEQDTDLMQSTFASSHITSTSALKQNESGYTSYIAGLIFIKLIHWLNIEYRNNQSVTFDQLLQTVALPRNRLHLNATGNLVWDIEISHNSMLKEHRKDTAWLWVTSRHPTKPIQIEHLRRRLQQFNARAVVRVQKISSSEFMIELRNQQVASQVCAKLTKDANYCVRLHQSRCASNGTLVQWSLIVASAALVSAFSLIYLTKRIKK